MKCLSFDIVGQKGDPGRMCHSDLRFKLSFSPLVQSVLPVSEGGAITLMSSNGEKATPPVTAARAGKEEGNAG